MLLVIQHVSAAPIAYQLAAHLVMQLRVGFYLQDHAYVEPEAFKHHRRFSSAQPAYTPA